MSDEKDLDVGDKNLNGGAIDDSKDQKKESVVSAEEFEKLRAQNQEFFKEIKSLKNKNKSFEDEKLTMEEQKLKEEGKLKELLAKKETQLEKLADKTKKRVLDTQVKEAALRAGCRPECLDDFMTLAGDYKDAVAFDDDFVADTDSLINFVNSKKDAFGSRLNLFSTEKKPIEDAGHGGAKAKPETKTLKDSLSNFY